MSGIEPQSIMAFPADMLFFLLLLIVGVSCDTYGEWSDWSECSLKCAGVGLQKKTRECLLPPCDGGNLDTAYKKCDRQHIKCTWQENEVCTSISAMIDDNLFRVKSAVAVVVLQKIPQCLGTIIERKRILVPKDCLPEAPDDLAKILIFRLDDPGSSVKIYATSTLDPYPLVLIMTSQSLFGDIRSFTNFNLDYETYLRRHWERESVLPRLSYMDPMLLDEACAYMVTFQDNMFKLRHFRIKMIRQYSRTDPQTCSKLPMLPGQICAATHIDFAVKTWMKGAPVLVNMGGRIFTVGLIVNEADYKTMSSIITINSIYHAYRNIGCNDFLFGYETPWRDVSNPESTAPSTCDCETWWDDQKACAFEPPLCVSEPELSPTINQLTTFMPSDCPDDQNVNPNIIGGFKCVHAKQRIINNQPCFCQNYRISYKCPYVLI